MGARNQEEVEDLNSTTDNLKRVAELRETLTKLRMEKDDVSKQLIPLVPDQIHYMRARNDLTNPSVRTKIEVIDHLNELIGDALSEYSALSLALSEEWLRSMNSSSTRLENATTDLERLTKYLLMATVILLGLSMLDFVLKLSGHP